MADRKVIGDLRNVLAKHGNVNIASARLPRALPSRRANPLQPEELPTERRRGRQQREPREVETPATASRRWRPLPSRSGELSPDTLEKGRAKTGRGFSKVIESTIRSVVRTVPGTDTQIEDIIVAEML